MRQKIKILTSLLALVFLVVGLASCDNDKVTITAESKVEVLVGKTKEIEVTVKPTNKLGELELDVSDSKIINANHKDGVVLVKGLKEGSATVTLKLGKAKHVITVEVKQAVVNYEEKTILELLENGMNNDPVSISGVVFAIASTGFYLEDNTGKIFVNLLGNETVALGDKLTLKGEFGLINNYPRLKAAVIASNDGTTTDFGTNVSKKTIQEVAALNRENKIGTYANLFEIVGTIIKDVGNIYKIMDEEGKTLIFSDISNLDILEANVNNRVELTVVLHDYNVPQQSWRVSFVGQEDDVVSKPLTLSELIPLVKTQINKELPSETYGVLVLPVEHPTIPSLQYEWSVDTNSFLTITNNKAVVDVNHFKVEGAVEEEVTLTLKITIGEQEESLTFTVKLMPIVQRTVSDLLENTPVVNNSYVVVSGRVLAFARNQSLSIRSYVIEDPVTKEVVTVDFSDTGSFILNSSDVFNSVKVGDDIVVHGQYRNYSRETLQNVTEIVIVSSGNEVVHDYDNAYVLNTEASYNEFGLNYEKYINKLVKIENPYFNFSTSGTPTQTNWVVINHNEVSGQVYDKQVNKLKFAFLLAAQSENLNNDNWMDMFNISYVGQEALLNENTIYAYALYVSATYLAFVIPSIDAIEMSLTEKVEILLESTLPKSVNPGDIITLPELKEHVTEGITWSSDNTVINVENGLVGEVSETTVVTLTATFMSGSDEVTLSFEVTVLPLETINVSEILAIAQNGYRLRVKGQVVGYFSDGNASGVRGLVIKDLVTSDIVYVNDPSDKLGTYANYFDINDDLLEIGDIVEIEGIFTITDVAPIRREFVVNDNTIIEIKEKDQEINFPEENMVVISSQAEMVAFFENPQVGVVIKFVGTEENPFAFGGSTNNPIATMNHKFFYNISAKENNDVKYPNSGGKVVSFRNENNRPNGGEYWWTDLFDLPENSFIGPTKDIPPIVRTGVFYAVFAAETGTYLQMDLINVENMSVIPIERRVEIVLGRELTLSVDAGGTLELPKLEDIIDGGIVWTSEDPLIDPETGQVGFSSEGGLVTLTATFLGKTLTYEITVLPKDKIYSVTEAVETLTTGIEAKFRGVIVGFHWNGSSTLGANTHGLILKDKTGNDVIYVTGLHGVYGSDKFVYTLDNEHVLAKSDEIELTATFNINTTKGFVGRKELVITDKVTANIEVLESDVSYQFNLEEAVVITDKETLTDVAENLPYGTLLKLEGALSFRSSSSTYGAGINFVPAFTPESGNTVLVDYNHATTYQTDRPQRFSVKFDGNVPNLGSNWWETLLGLNSTNFGGTGNTAHQYEEGFIYFYTGSALPTAATANGYIQLVILDPSWVNVERIIN